MGTQEGNQGKHLPADQGKHLPWPKTCGQTLHEITYRCQISGTEHQLRANLVKAGQPEYQEGKPDSINFSADPAMWIEKKKVFSYVIVGPFPLSAVQSRRLSRPCPQPGQALREARHMVQTGDGEQLHTSVP